MLTIELSHKKIEVKDNQLVFTFSALSNSLKDISNAAFLRDRFHLILSTYFSDLYPDINNEVDEDTEKLLPQRNLSEFCVLLNFKQPIDLIIIDKLFNQSFLSEKVLSEFLTTTEFEKILTECGNYFNLLHSEKDIAQPGEINSGEFALNQSIAQALQHYLNIQNKRQQLTKKLGKLKELTEIFKNLNSGQFPSFLALNIFLPCSDEELVNKINSLDGHILRLEQKIELERKRIEDEKATFDVSETNSTENKKPDTSGLTKKSRSLTLLENNLVNVEPVLLFSSLQEHFIFWQTNIKLVNPVIYENIFIDPPKVLFTQTAKEENKAEREQITRQVNVLMEKADQQRNEWQKQNVVINQNPTVPTSRISDAKIWVSQKFFREKERISNLWNERPRFNRLGFGRNDNE